MDPADSAPVRLVPLLSSLASQCPLRSYTPSAGQETREGSADTRRGRKSDRAERSAGQRREEMKGLSDSGGGALRLWFLAISPSVPAPVRSGSSSSAVPFCGVSASFGHAAWGLEVPASGPPSVSCSWYREEGRRETWRAEQGRCRHDVARGIGSPVSVFSLHGILPSVAACAEVSAPCKDSIDPAEQLRRTMAAQGVTMRRHETTMMEVVSACQCVDTKFVLMNERLEEMMDKLGLGSGPETSPRSPVPVGPGSLVPPPLCSAPVGSRPA